MSVPRTKVEPGLAVRRQQAAAQVTDDWRGTLQIIIHHCLRHRISVQV